ncbi:hypothetical protein [Kitasatospora camelliae]|uniref:SUKH superfamily protein n=1 Tax=Kitasatospora camelliae TaxID=3156397 RepID=A0AAU8JV42_9ACTN
MPRPRARCEAAAVYSFAELVEPCADRPPCPVPVDWAVVEGWLGLRLPGDYKAIADAYGPVDVGGGGLSIEVPRIDGASGFEYAEFIRDSKSACRQSSRVHPPYRPPLFHPVPGGLLPWGRTSAGGDLFWDTSVSPDPDRWTVVLHRVLPRCAEISPWQAYDLTLTGFVEAVLLDRVPMPGGAYLGSLPMTVARLGLLDEVGWRTDCYRGHRGTFPDDHPLAVWPEPGGFLPFGSTIDADMLGWLTEGEPDAWPLIVWPRHAPQGPRLAGGLVDTLVAWLRGRDLGEAFPGLDPEDDPLEFAAFQPWDGSVPEPVATAPRAVDTPA